MNREEAHKKLDQMIDDMSREISNWDKFEVNHIGMSIIFKTNDDKSGMSSSFMDTTSIICENQFSDLNLEKCLNGTIQTMIQDVLSMCYVKELKNHNIETTGTSRIEKQAIEEYAKALQPGIEEYVNKMYNDILSYNG
jgi:hypothetical protein